MGPIKHGSVHMKENIFSNNKPKKYLYKIGKKYFYPKDYYKKYYTPVKSGPYFSSGKPKKMYIENGKYIHIIKPSKPPKPSDFSGPPLPPTLLSSPEPRLLLPPPVLQGQRGPIPYGYYYRHAEKVKQKMRDRRLAFNKTLPPLNLICAYCNKLFVLPGVKENGHKQQPVKHCSYLCRKRDERLRKLWMPKWLYNFYLNKKLHRIKASFILYKIRWQYYPRVKNNIKRFFILSKKIFKKLKRKLKEVKKRENHYYKTKERFFTCKHCQEEFKRKSSATLNLLNFCSLKCKTLFNEEIIRRRKERNLAAWGTEERPDENTRRIIKKRKSLEYHKKRIAIDPAYKLIRRMRTRTRKVLKGIYKEGKVWKGKKLSIYEKLCISSGNELKEHIEAQWEEGMNWENYGKDRKGWVVDHHIPIAFYKNNFDLLNNLEIQKKAFGKDNLKPMWWLDNARKSAKLEHNASRPREN